MPDYKYLIIGGGMTADAAVKGIREVDADGTIGLISTEEDAPYDRPPLSKGLWKGKPVDDIMRGTGDANCELHLGRTATSLDAAVPVDPSWRPPGEPTGRGPRTRAAEARRRSRRRRHRSDPPGSRRTGPTPKGAGAGR